MRVGGGFAEGVWERMAEGFEDSGRWGYQNVMGNGEKR